MSFTALLPQSTPEVMGIGTANAAKEDTSPGFRMAFEQAIRRSPLVSVDLEVFRFGVDGDVLLGLVLDIDLRTYHTVENFVRSFGEFCGFTRHVFLGSGRFAAYPSYDGVCNSFQRHLNRTDEG